MFDTVTNIKESNKIAKTKRILVYPNITFSKDLEKDSYVQVLKNMINELADKDIFWTILSPKYIESLDLQNTEQLLWQLPTYPPAMRSHFDVMKFTSLIDHNKDFDLVLSHLPEHTHQIVNTLYNLTHHIPKVLGYVHWFDFDHIVTWFKDSFKQNICGLLEMEKCYINTFEQKRMVLKQAANTFNKETIDKLDKILTVQHLGVIKEDIIKELEDYEKIIVFNHRTDAYKHYNEFIKLIDILYKKRQDFKVWAPLLPGEPNRPYLTNEKYNKQEYYNHLKRCCVGFSPKQNYGGWSVATTDGLMNGCPYIMYDGDYYKELWKDADFFQTDDEAIALFERYLDDRTYRNNKAEQAINHLNNNLLYSNEIEKMYLDIESIIESIPARFSKKSYELIDLVKQNKSMTKKELFAHCGWGRGIKWNSYRRALISHPNIFDVIDSEPRYIWKEN